MPVPSLFDFLNDLNYEKKNLLKQNPEYEPLISVYAINNAMSQGVDTILYANELNKYADCSNKMAYDFYFHSVRKKKRFNKWAKTVDNEYIDVIMQYMEVNQRRAEEYLKILTDEQLTKMKNYLSKGGIKK